MGHRLPMDGSGGKTEGLCTEPWLDDERMGVSRAFLCTALLFTEGVSSPTEQKDGGEDVEG